MTAILIFIIVLGILIFVHELGHFLAAKWSGVRVEEFALGFPPTIASFKRGETTYALNALPIGGYVKLFGEDVAEEDLSEEEKKQSFAHQRALPKLGVMVAGVLMNVLLAFILATIAYSVGQPVTGDVPEQYVTDEETLVTSVLPDSPAETSDLLAGDIVNSVSDEVRIVESPTAEEISSFVSSSESDEVVLDVERKGENLEFSIPLSAEITEEGRVMGITTSNVSFVQYPLPLSVVKGAEWTGAITVATAQGIGDLFMQAFRGDASFDSVAGPVGIVGLVGDAYAVGFIYLLTFTALISINLAIINLFPIPALDGGRILFVLIETIKGSPLPKQATLIANGVGFVVLMLLMVLITIKDILDLIG